MKFIKFGVCLFLGVLLFESCKETPKKLIKIDPIVFTKEGDLTITKQTTGAVIASINIEIAESEYETQTGLMYRKSMEDNQAMLFIFPNTQIHSFYMKNTAISLDIIFIKEDFTVGSFQINAEPFNETGLSSIVPVKYVLEVNAGLVEKWQLQVGDTINYKKL